MNSRLFFAGLLAAFTAACGDGGTEPELQTGSLSFSYSGAESGTFAATGPLDVDGGAPTSDGAAAQSYGTTFTRIAAVRMAGSNQADIIQFALPAVTGPGSFSLDMECLSASYGGFTCPFAVIGLSVPTQSPPPGSPTVLPDGLYAFASGTITVTSVTATRIVGTFSGSAQSIEFDPSAGAEVITVTNGTFDVPRLNGTGG